jgi:hypothetical protein
MTGDRPFIRIEMRIELLIDFIDANQNRDNLPGRPSRSMTGRGKPAIITCTNRPKPSLRSPR